MRPAALGADDLQAQCFCHRDDRVAPHGEALCPQVHPHSGDHARRDEPPGVPAGLDKQGSQSCAGQFPGGRQSGDTAADDEGVPVLDGFSGVRAVGWLRTRQTDLGAEADRSRRIAGAPCGAVGGSRHCSVQSCRWNRPENEARDDCGKQL